MRSSDGNDVCAVVLCGGTGSRTGLSYNKVLYAIGHKTLLEYVLDAFAKSCVSRVVIAANEADRRAVQAIAASYENVCVVAGGDTRTRSVQNGLQAAAGCDIVVIHDGARPFVTPRLIDDTVRAAKAFGSGIAAVPAVDTVKEAENGVITKSLCRDKLWCMQTPQTFSYAQLCDAYAKTDGTFTDDAELFAAAGYTPHIVTGEYENKKITTPADLVVGAPAYTKIGTGFDVHPLCAGRELILGGVHIPHDKGLQGHSDADVLTHAVTDAILSAADLPDIGVLFPDTDPATEGIDSLLLLQDVCRRVSDLGYTVGNVSAVVLAQKPKLMPHIGAIRRSLCNVLQTDESRVNVSATTAEHLGIVGEEKGMAASASCLLTYDPQHNSK